MKIGYARVSTSKQELTNQVDTLKQAGAERIYQETMSGSRKDRPKLQEALNALKAGDTFIVTKADRIARSLSQLESTVTDLTARGVTVEVLNMGKFTAQSMDNPMNKLLFNVLGAFAEFERSMINERTQEGIRAAREKGVKF
ncbi:MAG TPA: resolvase, partial [Flavobacteriaceae bacterium]|nr:resolvase [Flavobacteriaceae bacterium]